MRAFFRELLITLIMAIAIFVGLRVLLQTFEVEGPSMEPTFQTGQRVLVVKVAYVFRPPVRGDVIVFQPPVAMEDDFIKRIIGLPGDTVEVKMGAVYVNGVKLSEPYIKESPRSTYAKTKVPENSYFVMGDNRNNSNDSRNNWMVPRQNIVGKAWFSIWPSREWGFVLNYPLARQLASP